MTRSKRMDRIAKMSRKFEHAAAQTLSAAQRSLDQYQQQLDELHAYREEYRASLRSGSALPMNGSEVQKLRAFIAQIDTIMEGLQAKIRQASQRHEREREAWVQQLRRSNAIDGIAGQARKQENNVEEARVQREIDDRVPAKFRA